MRFEVDIMLSKPSQMPEPAATTSRPCVRGKFLYVGEEKLYVRGVTYGTFRPDAEGHEYPSPEVVERDFAQMAARGINAVRTYTVPPRWLLDTAQRHGLYVLVGLAAERYVGYLSDAHPDAPDIEDLVRRQVRACAAHPAVLCYTLGNEIPAAIVRWLGRRRVERFLERLYRAAKAEDPEGLVTYVNYPSTEYLELPFLDLVCFGDRLSGVVDPIHYDGSSSSTCWRSSWPRVRSPSVCSWTCGTPECSRAAESTLPRCYYSPGRTC